MIILKDHNPSAFSKLPQSDIYEISDGKVAMRGNVRTLSEWLMIWSFRGQTGWELKLIKEVRDPIPPKLSDPTDFLSDAVRAEGYHDMAELIKTGKDAMGKYISQELYDSYIDEAWNIERGLGLLHTEEDFELPTHLQLFHAFHRAVNQESLAILRKTGNVPHELKFTGGYIKI